MKSKYSISSLISPSLLLFSVFIKTELILSQTTSSQDKQAFASEAKRSFSSQEAQEAIKVQEDLNALDVALGGGGTIEVADGGTGITSIEVFAPIVGGATPTGPFQAITLIGTTSGQVLTSNGPAALPSFQASGGVSSITGNTGGTYGGALKFSGGITGLSFAGVSGAPSTETLGGTLLVASGGTGLSSLSLHNVMIGKGTATVGFASPTATLGIPLVSAGAASDPIFGTASVPGGGTGVEALPLYNLVVGAGIAPVNFVAPSANLGVPLVSQGSSANPAYSAASVQGGGTGQTSLTPHSLVIGDGASPVTLLAPGTSGTALVSQGAGSDPIYSLVGVAGGGTGLSSLNQYNVIIGEGAANVGFANPTAVALGVPLVSAGAANPVFSTASVAGGGTGRTTLTAHNLLIGNDASNVTLLTPGPAGLALVSNGAADPSYQAVAVVGGGTGLTNLTPHSLVVGNGISAVTLLAPSATAGLPLVSNTSSSDPSFGIASVQGGGTGLATLTANSVLLGEGTAQVNFVSPVGTTSGMPLVTNGTNADPIFGTTSVVGGGTGRTALTAHNLLIGNGTSAVTLLPSGSAGLPLISTATDPVYQTLGVVGGGTGLSTITANGVLLGNGTSAIAATAEGATNTVLLGNTGAAPSFGVVQNAALANSSVTLSNGNNITVTGGSPLSLGGTASFNLTGTIDKALQVGNATGSLSPLDFGTSGQALVSAGAGALPVFGTLPVAGGGTGATTLTGVLTGNGINPVMVSTFAQHDVLLGGVNNTIAAASPTSTVAGYPFISNGSVANPSFGTYVNVPATTTSVSGTYQINGSPVLHEFGDNINNSNIFVGDTAGNFGLSGTNNVAVGATTLYGLTTGSDNTALGKGALLNINTGSNNTAIGKDAGTNYSLTDSSNICINNTGTASESHTLRIGAGTGSTNAGELNRAFIAGIRTANVTGSVVFVDPSDQLGIGTVPVASGGTGATTLTSHGVLLGNGTSAIAATAEGTTNTVLLGNTGAAPSFGVVPNAALANSSVTLSNGNNITVTGSPLSLGGTASFNLTGTTNNALQVGNATGSLSSLGFGTSGQALVSAGAGAAPAFGTLPVAGGGTGVTTFVAYAPVVGGTTSTGALQSVASVGTAGQVLTSQGAGALPVFANASGGTTITGDVGGTLSGSGFTFTGGATGLSFGGSGTTEALGGTLAVGSGGTGATTLTGILRGNGTSAVTASPITQYNVLIGGASNAIGLVAPGAAGIPLVSTGAASNPIFGTATVIGGGTGLTSLSTNQLLAGGTLATGNLQQIGSGTVGQALVSNGAALPSFGTLPVAGGGTGATTLTGILTGNGAGAVTASPVAQYNVLVGAAGNAVSSVVPSVTTGLPLISNGSGVNPSFGSYVNVPATTSLTSGSYQIGGFRALHEYGSGTNIFVGKNTGNFTMGANTAQNTGVGFQALIALDSVTSGVANTAVGAYALSNCTTGNNNTAIGNYGLVAVQAGSENTAIGNNSGNGLTLTDSSNICINNNGTAGDNNTLRIGAGTGNSVAMQLSKAFISGINSVDLGSTNTSSLVRIDNVNDQLGTSATNAALTINTGTGVLGISTDAAATTVNVGTGAAAKTVNIGSTSAASTTTIQSGGTGVNALNINSTGLGGEIGIATNNGQIAINSGTGLLSLSGDFTDSIVNLGTGAGVKTVTVGSLTGASATTLRSGTGNLAIASANGPLTINSGTGLLSLSGDFTDSTVNLGTGAGVKTVTVGSLTGASATTLRSGTGNLAIASANGPLTINSGTGILGISTDATATTVNVGTGAAAKTVNIGSTSAASTTTIQSGGTGVNALNINSTGLGGEIGIATNNGQIAINSGTGLLSLSGDFTDSIVNLGTGAGVKTVTVGSLTGASATTLRSGTGNLAITSLGTGVNALNISSSGTAGALNVTAANGPLTINSGTGILGISTDAAATTVNVGTGAAAKTVTVGSLTGASATTLRSGTGNLAITSLGTGVNALNISSSGTAGALNVTAANGPLTINSGTGILGISTDTAATTVNVGTGAAAKTVNIGSTSAASTTTIQSGGTSGNVININSTGPGGAIGITTNNGQIAINSGTGLLSLSGDFTNSTVNLGTGAGVKTVTVGSLTGASTTTLNSGTGGVQITSFLNVPNTTSATVGTYGIAGAPILHRFGDTWSTFLGFNAGNFTLTVGNGVNFNTGLGAATLNSLTTGNNNTAAGVSALQSLTTGSSNTGLGRNSLLSLTTGFNNTAIGSGSGSAINGADHDNIYINNTGIAGDTYTMRIGAGTGTAGGMQIGRVFFSGINGVTTLGGTGVPVLISNGDQLGTTASSRRFKDNIKDMPDEASSPILQLRPVTFTYTVDRDPKQILRTGLIAEEVEAIMPQLVFYDKDGLPASVLYHELPTLLLNELKKTVRKVTALEAAVAAHLLLSKHVLLSSAITSASGLEAKASSLLDSVLSNALIVGSVIPEPTPEFVTGLIDAMTLQNSISATFNDGQLDTVLDNKVVAYKNLQESIAQFEKPFALMNAEIANVKDEQKGKMDRLVAMACYKSAVASAQAAILACQIAGQYQILLDAANAESYVASAANDLNTLVTAQKAAQTNLADAVLVAPHGYQDQGGQSVDNVCTALRNQIGFMISEILI